MADPELFPLIRYLRLIARTLAIISLLVFIIIYDILMSPSFYKKAIIIGNYQSCSKGPRNHIKAEGSQIYNEPVEESFYPKREAKIKDYEAVNNNTVLFIGFLSGFVFNTRLHFI